MISLKINSLIVEGGSTLIITFLSHLQNGSPSQNLSVNWCLARLLVLLLSRIQALDVILHSHVHHMTNKLDDSLANVGLEEPNPNLNQAWDAPLHPTLQDSYISTKKHD